MSQHIPLHHQHPTLNHHPHHQQQRPLSTHHHQTTYISYPVSAQAHLHPNASPVLDQNHGIAPQDTTRQPIHPQSSPTGRAPLQAQHPQQIPPHPQQPQKQVNAPAAHPYTNGIVSQPGPLVATGDWTKDLVHLAKTAELKFVSFRKHALTLQLHTAHILSAHASLEHKSKTLQDVREQKNKLDSERSRLLTNLREINEDRDKADLMEASINKECEELRKRIEQLSEGEYTSAKKDVDRLRYELGQPPLPTIQATLEERKAQYLNERRLNANDPSHIIKRTGEEEQVEPLGKRPRGRPKGSKNRPKSGATSEAPPVSSS